MLAYIDYPGDRRIVTGVNELIEAYKSFPGALASTIVMIGGVGEVNEDYFKAWLSVTGSRGIVEDTYGEVASYIKGLAGDRDLVSLVMRAYGETRELIDLIALSNALKLFLNLNIYDLGLAVIYENPLMALNGLRVELRSGGRALMTGRHRVEGIELSTALILQHDSSKVMVDWGNPGVLPASSAVGDESISDPAYTALMSGVKLSSRLRGTRVTLVTPQPQLRASSGDCGGEVVILPLTLMGSLRGRLVGELAKLGVKVTGEVNIIDALSCISNAAGADKP